MCTQFNLAPGPRKLFWNLCKSVASRASINCRPDTSPSQCWSSLIPRCRFNLVVHMSHLRLEGRVFFWCIFVYTFESTLPPCLWNWSKIPASQTQAKCKSCKPILSGVKVFWYLGVDLRRWPICTHLRLMVRVFAFNPLPALLKMIKSCRKSCKTRLEMALFFHI